MTVYANTTITDGVDQESRKLPALMAGYFNVDELVFEELLAMGADFASAINFYNLKNEVNGNWGEIFNADEAVIMAAILSTDLKRIESDYLSAAYYSQESLIHFILDLALKVNYWFTRLEKSQHQSGEELAQKMAEVIYEKLAIELHNVGEIIKHVKSDAEPGSKFDFSVFENCWHIVKDDNGYKFPLSDFSDSQNTGEIKQQLFSSLNVFLNSISYIKTITPKYFHASLANQQHNPAISVYIVFLKLYEKAQRKLNTFTQRHLDFYYQKILKVKNKEFVPECVYLQFEAQPGVDKAIIKKNTEFSAGKDKQLNDIIYRAEEEIQVTDAKIKSLATLYLQHDELISPESELGYVTRIKSSRPDIPEPDSDKERWISWPLFGAEKYGEKRVPSVDAHIGFYLASPLLLLKEGVRKIKVGVVLESQDKLSIDSLVLILVKSKTELEFTQVFGRLFSHYLLSYGGCLSSQHKEQIITKAEQLLSKNISDEVLLLLTHDWQGLFYKLFRKIFCIKLTTEDGWLDVSEYIIEPLSDAGETSKMGLAIQLNLGQEIVPITPYLEDVYAEKLPTKFPILQCYINPQTNFYPYSLFHQLIINSLQLNIEVKGVKNILAYNQHGQLEPSKPFQPFGPLPTGNSYFVFGNYELARKPLTDLSVNVEWGELPPHTGGFDEYYRGYDTHISNDTFKGEFTALANSCWVPDDSTTRDKVKLFDSEAEHNRICAKKTIAVNILEYTKPIDSGIEEDMFQYGLKTRRGFFKLSLAGPGAAFGHKEYAELLTKTLSANARLKKQKMVPNLPYTPVINSISLDYKASSQINLTVRVGEDNGLGQIMHMHPFGIETIYPTLQDNPSYLLPQYHYQGNLFIGLSANNIPDVISLFFHMSDDSEKVSQLENSVIDWYYLSSNRWKIMSARRVQSDSTNRFLSSGKVTLNIPDDITLQNTVMPADYYWLRVSTRGDARAFSGFLSISTHALKVKRKIREGIDSLFTLPESTKWTSVSSIPGISKITQAGKTFAGRAVESDEDLIIRISERLRHKNRALAPWDYEHLILAQFPHIYKVKCFPTTSDVGDTIKPGHVLIVVVPDPQSYDDDTCKKAMIDAERLRQIKAYIKQFTSPFVEIKVRNPVYEQVQLRCTVKFLDDFGDGVNINRLNQDITNYICPWKKGGYVARFGWSIRQKDIESYIRSLAYVDFITNVSMLHITADSMGKYNLYDTAKDTEQNEAVIRPKYPWSLALPVKKHFIETMQVAKSIKEEITGINELEVGSTFIISGASKNG